MLAIRATTTRLTKSDPQNTHGHAVLSPYHTPYFLPHMSSHLHVIGEDEEREEKERIMKEK